MLSNWLYKLLPKKLGSKEKSKIIFDLVDTYHQKRLNKTKGDVGWMWAATPIYPFLHKNVVMKFHIFQFGLIWEVGGKVGVARPFLVSNFYSNNVSYLWHIMGFWSITPFFIKRFCRFSIPNKPYIWDLYCAFNRQTDIARST